MADLSESFAKIIESQNIKDKKLLIAEKEFYTTHNHAQVISKYPSSIDKILVVDASPCTKDIWGIKRTGALFDFDAVKLRGAVRPKWRWNMKKYPELDYALDYLIDQKDKRWSFLYEIPPSVGKGVDKDRLQMPKCYPKCGFGSQPNPSDDERWIVTSYCTRCPDMFRDHDEIATFYRKLTNEASSFCNQYRFQPTEQLKDTLLGFFCRGCDKHYDAD